MTFRDRRAQDRRGYSSIVALAAIVMLAFAESAEATAFKNFLVSPTSFDFGDVPIGGPSANQQVTVTNVSQVPIVVSIAGGGAGQFGGFTDCQGKTLTPGQSCHITYQFTPTALGPVTGNTSGNINGQPFAFNFAGNGVRRYSVSPTGFDFGDVPVGRTSANQQLTVTNVSTSSVVVSIAGGGAGQFGGFTDCQGKTLTPGQSCHITYQFRPTAAGPATGSTGGNINGQPFSFTFAGNGFNATHSDFDADGKADPAVYRPSTGQWIFLKSNANYTTSTVLTFGASTDLPVPGDYDGDGILDLGLYRPSTGQWLVLTSSSGYVTQTTTAWGNSTDVPVPGDYDGDGKTDAAVFRPSDGTWYIKKSTTGTQMTVPWGNSADRPVPGDYDSDGRTDVAVFRPSDGTWYIINSSTGTQVGIPWGTAADLTVAGDYDGDGKTDLGVYRAASGTWYVLQSSTNYTTYSSTAWGVSTDVPVPGDYDGDGKADVAVYRPSEGMWYIIRSSAGTSFGLQWGESTDIPLPETYLIRWAP